MSLERRKNGRQEELTLTKANLGNVQLLVNVPVNPNGAGQARQIDVYSVSHNIIQMKRGDVIKALR